MTQTQDTGTPRPEPSAAAARAALEITEKLPVHPVYSQALTESFAEIVERHTHCGELLAACELAKEALSIPNASSQAARQQREAAIVALERAMAAVARRP